MAGTDLHELVMSLLKAAVLPTWSTSVEDLHDLRDICKPLCIDVSTLTQVLWVVARQLKRRVSTQRTTPVIQEDWKREFPLLDLIADYVVDLLLNEL